MHDEWRAWMAAMGMVSVNFDQATRGRNIKAWDGQANAISNSFVVLSGLLYADDMLWLHA